MREPVTTSSWTLVAAGAADAAVCACASVTDTAARAAPEIMDDARRRVRMVIVVK
jgi:hypothetical protein